MIQADGINSLIKVGFNSDVISAWKQVYEQYKNQPEQIIDAELYDCSTDEKCRAIFSYLAKNIHYKLDPYGVQYIKTPARLLKDGEGDCKSYTMFIASCLHCLGVPCRVRFVNYDGGNQYTHVYPVAVDEYGREIILDACELDAQGMPKYNYARGYKRKKDLVYNE